MTLQDDITTLGDMDILPAARLPRPDPAHIDLTGFVTRQEFEEHIARITQDIHESLARIEQNTNPKRRSRLSLANSSPDVQERILRDFFREALLNTADPNARITRTDLFGAFVAYHYQWLRRAVTDRGMSDDEATDILTNRLSATRFTRTMNTLIRSGELPHVQTTNSGGTRAWVGLAYRTWVIEMRENPDNFDLTAAAGKTKE